MSSLWTELLFLHAYIDDSRLAHRLVAAEASKPKPPPKKSTPLAPWHKRLTRRLCAGIGDGVAHVQ
jgi:hypothetical protein